jgi:hypothetical protein
MKIKTVLKFLSLVCIVFLSGCASVKTGCPSDKTWYKSGTSAEERRRDLAMCQNEALVYGRSYSPIPADSAGQAIALGMLASAAESSRENKIIQTCMIARGYTMVNKNSTILTNNPYDGEIREFSNYKRADGSIYTGTQKFSVNTGMWLPEGTGKRTMTNGAIGEGEWEAGYFVKGKMTGTNGTTIEGEFVNAQIVKAKVKSPEGSEFMLEWNNGHYNQEGTEVEPDGTKYVGVWKYGGKSGGTITWKDGREYKGDWTDIEGKADLPDGEGEMTWPDGRKYVGDFRNGKQDGAGKMNCADGHVEEGLWRDDKFIGALAK